MARWWWDGDAGDRPETPPRGLQGRHRRKRKRLFGWRYVIDGRRRGRGQSGHEWTCAGCATIGDGLLLMQDDEPHCVRCVQLNHLVFLPAGDAGRTRRARRASTATAVVVRFSRSRKRYERQGLLVEPDALEGGS